MSSRTYTEAMEIQKTNDYVQHLKRKKKRDRRFKRKYKNKKTVDDILKEYDIRDTKKLQFIKRQLINSGGAICGICGRPILDMKDCTIDHIKPRSKGGMTTLDNCQLAHKACNLQKGNAYDILEE